ncbi:MAG TPA: TIGR02234 family membrane protein [Yinghuangia sp.]|nr:TIGR02234 family membrane protein [Yinghuangia sp.]
MADDTGGAGTAGGTGDKSATQGKTESHEPQDGHTDTALAVATDTDPADGDTSPAPEPADRSARSARQTVRREMGTALLLVAVGAALVLSLGGRVWAEGTALVHGSGFAIEATGSSVTKVPAALAVLALAGGVAALATRGRGRILVGAILALAGAGIAAAAASGASDRSALDARAASKAAVEGAQAVDVSHTVWPWITLIGGLLIAAGGLVVVARGRNWPGMGSRYEAPGARAPRRAATSADMWNALDRGEDPTR